MQAGGGGAGVGAGAGDIGPGGALSNLGLLARDGMVKGIAGQSPRWRSWYTPVRGRLRPSPLQISLARDALALVRSACGMQVPGDSALKHSQAVDKSPVRVLLDSAIGKLKGRDAGAELVAEAKALCNKMWWLLNSDARVANNQPLRVGLRNLWQTVFHPKLDQRPFPPHVMRDEADETSIIGRVILNRPSPRVANDGWATSNSLDGVLQFVRFGPGRGPGNKRNAQDWVELAAAKRAKKWKGEAEREKQEEEEKAKQQTAPKLKFKLPSRPVDMSGGGEGGGGGAASGI